MHRFYSYWAQLIGGMDCLSADYFFFCDINIEFQAALLCRYPAFAYCGIIRKE